MRPRTRTLRVTVLAALLCAAAVSAWAQADIQTVAFFSESVERPTKYNIVLPRGYESSDRRYPVLYLLHGLSQNYQAWSRQGVGFYAPLFDMIIVMPDAGNSWYVNWAQSDGGQKNDWEDHIVRDLIGHVDANYRTIARREGRAINGLSMGGYGGLALGLRHPDLFVSIGATAARSSMPAATWSEFAVEPRRAVDGGPRNRRRAGADRTPRSASTGSAARSSARHAASRS